MNTAPINQIVGMDSNHKVMRALEKRRAELLGAIADRTLEPTKEICDELAELNIALGDFDPIGDAS